MIEVFIPSTGATRRRRRPGMHVYSPTASNGLLEKSDTRHMLNGHSSNIELEADRDRSSSLLRPGPIDIMAPKLVKPVILNPEPR